MRIHLFIGFLLLSLASPAIAGGVADRATAKGSGLSASMSGEIKSAVTARSGEGRPLHARGVGSLYSADMAKPSVATKNGERFASTHSYQTVPVDKRVNRIESRTRMQLDVATVGTTTTARRVLIEKVRTKGNGWNGYGHISDHKVSNFVKETVRPVAPGAKIRTTKTIAHTINPDGTRTRSNHETQTLIIGEKEIRTWTPKQ